MKRIFHVYILTNASKMLYTGVTNDLHRRVYEHKHKLVPGFSAKYNLHRLAFFEAFGHIGDASPEKSRMRSRKVALIESQNPKWQDLATDWFKTAKARDELSAATNMSTTKPLSS